MKIEGIEFNAPLCDALREGKLVIFAGAGVSMGEPACLPSFKCLADMIAEGTGQTWQNAEPWDRFLGSLKHQGVDVHARAAQALSQDGLQPTDLHRDLLRLCSDAEHVRIVTTNFDLLFEQAATDVFDFKPEIFRAPALPLGQSFDGIVHIHGAVSHPDGMVLTDQDFGRAYLTEGWARRFLVELFRQFTILFVGYGHKDIVINYLARALPESKASQRFALTEEDADDQQRWRNLGIEPVTYPQLNKDDHSKLHAGVRRLAEVFDRGVLDWRREITELAGNNPAPHDSEEADLIAEALKDETKTRFFTEADSPVEWIGWLDKCKHLDALFGSGTLNQPDRLLAQWLAERFAFRHADELFLLIARHGSHLHPFFWLQLGRKISFDKQDSRDRKNLPRWVSLLLATAPVDADEYVLAAMGERCADNELVDSLLHVFDTMAGSRLLLKPGSTWSNDGQDDQGPAEVDLRQVGHDYGLEKLWEIIQGPTLAQKAEPLLGIVVRRLEERRLTLRAWQKTNREWDSESFDRSAIEPHHQNGWSGATDVLIDTARDCLEWLAANEANTATRWCDQLAGSEAPLLRRLATHTLSVRTDLAAEQKIDWVLKHIGLHDLPVHHEIFRAVKLAYPEAGPDRRKDVLEAVLIFRCPNDDEDNTARYRFEWLHWLHEAAPDCSMASRAMEEVRSKYPSFQPTEHPDFTHWTDDSGLVSPKLPWTIEQLLARPAEDWLPELLAFKSTEFFRSDDGVVLAVQNAVKQNFDWGLDLADALAEAGKWNVDHLWYGLIRVWATMELDEDSYHRVLNHLGRAELYPKHGREIADALIVLVKGQGTSYALKLLPQANEIAAALWDHLDQNEPPEKPDDWLGMAINDAAGVLAEFWLHSLAIWHRQQEPPPKALSDEYSKMLASIVRDRTLAGRLGRSFLAGQFAFLLAVDEAWTKENLLRFFYAGRDADDDFQATWDGFLTLGRFNPAVAECLGDAFLKAVQRTDKELGGQRERRFIKSYTTMLGYFSTDPLDEWVPELFRHGSVEVPRLFAFEVGRHLHGMAEARQREWWSCWLKRYWENRLQGVPPQCLKSDEAGCILGWLRDLTAVFPEAVALAIRMLKLPTIGPLEHGHSVIAELSRSDSLVQNHPKEVAQLLIHLGRINSEAPQWRSAWYGRRELIDQLLQSDLSPELVLDLKELKAKRGP